MLDSSAVPAIVQHQLLPHSGGLGSMGQLTHVCLCLLLECEPSRFMRMVTELSPRPEHEAGMPDSCNLLLLWLRASTGEGETADTWELPVWVLHECAAAQSFWEPLACMQGTCDRVSNGSKQ